MFEVVIGIAIAENGYLIQIGVDDEVGKWIATSDKEAYTFINGKLKDWFRAKRDSGEENDS